jgi:hypothetical protein
MMGLSVTITPAMVKEVINTDLTDEEIEGFIASAIVMFSQYLGSSVIPNGLQVEILKYLAAHFLSMREDSTRTTLVEEKIGDASRKWEAPGSFSGSDGLNSTRWGQTAVMLDPTRILANLVKNAPPSLVCA